VSFTATTVTFTYTGSGGAPAAGTVSFQLTYPITDGADIIVGDLQLVTLDASGYGSITLPANDDSTTLPTGTGYIVTEKIQDTSPRTYTVILSKSLPGHTVDLSTLAPASTQVLYPTMGPQGYQGFQGAQGVYTSNNGQGPQDKTLLWLDQSATGNGTQGPQGFQGPQGIQGAGFQGAQGTTGAQGAQGSNGSTGAQGNTGAQGATGSTGAQGATGSQGAAGAQGSNGAQGTTGAQGSTGAQGVTGSQGAQGAQGLTGSTGTQGATGAQGPTGSQGATGNQGAIGSQGSTGAQGATGSQGTQGNGVATGGTTGQILAKNSGTNYDTGWVNPLYPTAGIPAMHGYVAWTNDPAITASQSTAQTPGVPNYQMVYLQQGQVISNITVVVVSGGTSISNSYLGLYNSTTQLAVTGAITTPFTSSGVVKTAFTSPYTVPSTGYYWVALLIGNGSTTGPRFAGPGVGNSTFNAGNAGLTAASGSLVLRYGILGSGQTALPSSISGTQTSSVSYVFWAGLN
jgi:hypothetical protein